MQNIETIASSLDAQALDVLQSFQFSDSPLLWSSELAWIFPQLYHFMARSTKKDIRSVARFFQRTNRIDPLSGHLGEFTIRNQTAQMTYEAVDLLTSVPSGLPRVDNEDLWYLRERLPIIRGFMDSVSVNLSRLKHEFCVHLEVFIILESRDRVELLLSSLPSTIPEAFVTQGQGLIGQLVRLWSERRVLVAQASDLAAASQDLQELEGRLESQRGNQTAILASFKDLVDQVKRVPVLCLPDREFSASAFLGASASYRRLLVQRMSLHGDFSRLEHNLDRYMDIIERSIAQS